MKTNTWNASQYSKYASFVPKLATNLIDLLGDIENKKVLDLGCGDGSLTLELIKKGADVIGVDLSPDMVKASRLKGITAYIRNATNLPFIEEFDVVFSNAVLHWILEAEKAVENIKKSLKKGGIFVAELGGKGNIESIKNAIQQVFEENNNFGKFENKWYFPDVDDYKNILEKSGFRVEYIELIPRPTNIDDIEKWLEIFTNVYTSHLSEKQEKLFRKKVKEKLEKTIYDKEKGWIADYVRIRVKAIKQ